MPKNELKQSPIPRITSFQKLLEKSTSERPHALLPELFQLVREINAQREVMERNQKQQLKKGRRIHAHETPDWLNSVGEKPITFEMACQIWFQKHLEENSQDYAKLYILLRKFDNFFRLINLSARSTELHNLEALLKKEKLWNRKTKRAIRSIPNLVQQLSFIHTWMAEVAYKSASESEVKDTEACEFLNTLCVNFPLTQDLVSSNIRFKLRHLFSSEQAQTISTPLLVSVYRALIQTLSNVDPAYDSKNLLQRLDYCCDSLIYKPFIAKEESALATDRTSQEDIKQFLCTLTALQAKITDYKLQGKKKGKGAFPIQPIHSNYNLIKYSLMDLPTACKNTVFEKASFKEQLLAVTGEIAIALSQLVRVNPQNRGNSPSRIFEGLKKAHDQFIRTCPLPKRKQKLLSIQGKSTLLREKPLLMRSIRWLGLGMATLSLSGLLFALSAAGILPIALITAGFFAAIVIIAAGVSAGLTVRKDVVTSIKYEEEAAKILKPLKQAYPDQPTIESSTAHVAKVLRSENIVSPSSTRTEHGSPAPYLQTPTPNAAKRQIRFPITATAQIANSEHRAKLE